MFKAIRTAVGRLFGRASDDETTEAPEQQPAPTAETQPKPQQPRHPDYRPLNAAVEAAQNGQHEKARQLIAYAQAALCSFPRSRSLMLAGAALVNAEDANFGIAGRLIESAMVQFLKDGRNLSPDERRFVMEARERTLRKVPIEKLKFGPEISRDRQEARKLCDEGHYGQAILLLKRAARATHASTCLRTHPCRPWETLLALIDEAYAAIERQDTATRMNELYIGETGTPLPRTMATAA